MFQCASKPQPARDREMHDGLSMSWAEYERVVAPTVEPFEGLFRRGSFDYVHPLRLQGHHPEHQRKEVAIHAAYTAWGDPGRPLLLCLGGIANNARRWDYLARGLRYDFFVVCLDWLGRGESGWMPLQADYALPTYVEQVRQLARHLGRDRLDIVGSSMGGSVGLALNALYPGLVRRLVLNDIGPHIPVERRSRRAQAVARHHVFKAPADLFRRGGAAAKNDGPVSDDELLHNTYFQTRWSDADRGRVYRHDPRALQAYASEASTSLDQWEEWQRVEGPVMLIHGMLSDALLPPTIERMKRKEGLVVMHVPETGHTPSLSDIEHIHWIQRWLSGSRVPGEFVAVNSRVPPRRLFAPAPVSPPAAPAPSHAEHRAL